MTIILLDPDRLKICLDKPEMLANDIDGEKLDYRDPAARSALVALLRKASSEAGFHPRGAKVIVEILPDGNGGCVICFTAVHGLRLSPEGGGIEPAVYEFKNAFDLAGALGELYSRYGHRIYKSSLYGWQGAYRLVVRALDYADKQSESFLLEFAEKVGAGEIFASYIDEHGELISADNAIDVIGRVLEV